MTGRSPFKRTLAVLRMSAGPLPALLVLSILCAVPHARADEAANAALNAADTDTGEKRPPAAYGRPPEAPGVPSPAELEASGAVIGQVIIDNQNIFNLDDPRDDNALFRLANRLHVRTRASVIRRQLLFKSGDPYDRRVIDESERILRLDGIFYDAWIREVGYHEGKVDLQVTTRDVWTLNPGFNYSRSGGTNSTGIQLEEINLLGFGTDLKVSHTSSIDRTTNGLQVSDNHLAGTWISFAGNWVQASDGHLHELSVQRPFYALNTPWAAGVYGLNDIQTDSLWDRGQIIDQFRDQHEGAQVFGGWSEGLKNGWVRRYTIGFTYDEHLFAPLPTSTGPSPVPADRRFLYPFVQFDLIQDDFQRLWNHDQIARTEDFYLGTSLTVRTGYADASMGSSSSAFLFHSNASTGFRGGHKDNETLLLAGDFSGRVSGGQLVNGLADASVRYYVEQSKNWLFFTTLVGTKGWRLDLDNQILLGGDNGLRGYPLRYQAGTSRALFSVEQRYFTDWYPFRLFRVGGAIFFDAGRTWGIAPPAAPSLGLLKDAGFGLRFGNARSGLGAVIHVDLAFPFDGDRSINRVQFLVQTEAHF
jgi:hypothetical protein